MKKTILILISILVGLFIFLKLIIPENNYLAEKRMWKINSKLYKMVKNRNTTKEEFDKIILKYKNFIDRNPESTSVVQAYIFRADAYMFKKDYKGARQKYREIIQKYPDQPVVAEIALTKIINSYYRQGNTEEKDDLFNQTIGKEDIVSGIIFNQNSSELSEKVGKVYQRAVKEYPKTLLGIKAPLLIAKLYHDQNEITKSRDAINSAIIYYKKFNKQNENTIYEFQANEFLVLCYMLNDDFVEAINVLGDSLIEYAKTTYLTGENALNIAKQIAALSSRIKNDELPLSIFQKFMTLYPQHPFNDVLKKVTKGYLQVAK